MTTAQGATNRIVQQARAEYLEMPGLRLTPRQAARLWHLDIAQSERALNELTEAGFLLRDLSGTFGRLRCPRCD